MKTRNVLWSYFFVAPNLLFLSLFLLYPLIYTIYLSFNDANLYTSTFVGFDNYKNIFQSTLFHKSLINTFYYILLIVPAVVIISLIFAAMMQGLHKRAKNIYRLIFYLPVVSTPVVLSLVWSWMYNPSIGIINYLGNAFGMEKIDVFANSTSAILALSVIVVTWMVGQPLILYMSAIDGISGELYEAAEIDGAGTLRKFFSITLPLVSQTTLLIVVTSTISVFQIFVVVHLITNGGPFHGTESLVYTIYQTAFVSLQFGEASAQSVILFIIIVLIAFIQFKLMRSTSK